MSTGAAQNMKDAQLPKPEARREAKEDQHEVADKTESSRLEQSGAIVRKNVLWALGVGFVPFPIVDVLAIMGVQTKMLQELSKLYEQNFSEGLAKKLIATLLSSLGIVGIGGLIGGSLAKFIPALGTTLGLLTIPALAGAVTHATGKVFTMHFEAGGTLLNFDPKQMRAYFKQEFENAKEVVAHIQQDQKAKSSSPA